MPNFPHQGGRIKGKIILKSSLTLLSLWEGFKKMWVKMSSREERE